MSLLEGWFKKPEEKEELQEIVNAAVEEKKLTHLLAEDKLEASQAVDDQEFNNAAQALFTGKNLDDINPEEVDKVLEKIDLSKDENTESHSNYITKN